MTDRTLPATTTAVATTASSGASCSANIGGVIVLVNLARDLTVAVGDTLLVHVVGQQYFGCCRLYSATVSTDDIEDGPDPNVATVAGRTVFFPVATGTYRDGAWLTSTTDTMQGATGGYGNATGAAFYGGKPGSLAGAVVTAATVRLRRDRSGDPAPVATTLRLVTETAKPSGAPTLTSTTAGPTLGYDGADDAYPVPTAWAQGLADGTAGGLAVADADGSPYARLAGLGSDPAAWVLTIDWQRTS